MAREPSTREAKLIQYLNEAYGKEKELEAALKAHISMTSRDAYKKRLREHLKETSAQAKELERRIRALGGKAEAVTLPGPEVASEAAAKVTAVAKKGVALAQGPLHAIRGTGEAEKLLKNAKTELFNEFEEIANYLAIEELANGLHDADTAKLAKEFRRQEERMATFLQRLIPQLAKQVVRDEVPARERKPAPAAAATNGRAGAATTTTAAAKPKPAASRSTAAAKKPTARTRAAAASTAKKPATRTRAAATATAKKPATRTRAAAASTAKKPATRSRAAASGTAAKKPATRRTRTAAAATTSAAKKPAARRTRAKATTSRAKKS
jgi:ferritin-like metal-binding protein YciE